MLYIILHLLVFLMRIINIDWLLVIKIYKYLLMDTIISKNKKYKYDKI